MSEFEPLAIFLAIGTTVLAVCLLLLLFFSGDSGDADSRSVLSDLPAGIESYIEDHIPGSDRDLIALDYSCDRSGYCSLFLVFDRQSDGYATVLPLYCVEDTCVLAPPVVPWAQTPWTPVSVD